MSDQGSGELPDEKTVVEHPFAELIGLDIVSKENGHCTATIKFDEKLLNPNNVVHGGAIYSLADTSMGGAVKSVLHEDELCATIEIKIVYLRAAGHADLSCRSHVIKHGRRVAFLESEIYSGEELVAKATGSFAVF